MSLMPMWKGSSVTMGENWKEQKKEQKNKKKSALQP